jgi:hypothetical protein
MLKLVELLSANFFQRFYLKILTNTHLIELIKNKLLLTLVKKKI